jgi:RNA polymerase sigma factor (sigma-70 family)
MAVSAVNSVILHLRRLALLQNAGGLPDAELLEWYVVKHDASAFEALVRRHGPMVLGVGRRILRNEADAEDVFQATFLVLVRKAALIRSPATLNNWLYGVAHNIALKAKAMNRKRRLKEREAGQARRVEAAEDVCSALRARLDGELVTLHDRYRAAIVLCDLEGKTIKEAARQLGCPRGTVASRLARGRALLAKRLRNGGPVLSGGVLTVALSSSGRVVANVPPALLASAMKVNSLCAAGQAVPAGAVSTRVAALAEGVIQTMFLSKLKSILVVALVALAGVAIGSGFLPFQTATQAAASSRAALQHEPRTADSLRQLEAVKWTLLRIDRAQGTLHIADTPSERSWGTDAAEQLLASAGAQLSLRGLPVAKDAKITLDGKELPLKDLHEGVNLSLKFAEDRPIIKTITATTPPRAGYTVKRVDVDKYIIEVTGGKDTKPLVLNVDRNEFVSNVLRDLKVGTHVSVHVEVQDGKMVVKELRVR